MKKLSMFLIGLVSFLSITGVTFAQEKARPAKSAKAAKERESRNEEFRAGGLVTALDVVGNKITIKQDKIKKERTLTLTVSQQVAEDLGGIKVGDVVNVWVDGRVITALQKVF